MFGRKILERNGPNCSRRFVIYCNKIQSIKCVTNRKVHLFQPIVILQWEQIMLKLQKTTFRPLIK